MLFAARRKTMQLCKRQFFLELEDTLLEGVLSARQRGDFGSIRRQKRHQLRNGRGCRLVSS